MNSGEPSPPHEEDQGSDLTLNLGAEKLKVHRHERLAYTELPKKKSVSGRLAAGKAAYLRAKYYWVLWRS